MTSEFLDTVNKPQHSTLFKKSEEVSKNIFTHSCHWSFWWTLLRILTVFYFDISDVTQTRRHTRRHVWRHVRYIHIQVSLGLQLKMLLNIGKILKTTIYQNIKNKQNIAKLRLNIINIFLLKGEYCCDIQRSLSNISWIGPIYQKWGLCSMAKVDQTIS